MPLGIVQHFLPRLDVLAGVQAAMPHVTVTQITGGWGRTSLVPNPKAAKNDAENERRANLVGELVDFVRFHGGGDALCATYQAIEARFQVPGVRTCHWNAVAGLDEYGQVRSLFAIGRPLPDARDVRAMAMALTGRVIEPENGQRESRGVLMADGSGVAMNVRTFADPDMEALRAAITDTALVQGAGRGRGVRREADTPLHVFVFADVVMPFPVNRLVAWEHVRLNVVQRMLARGAALFSPSDAARVYPDLFGSPDAARMALNRCQWDGSSEQSPKITSNLGDCSDDCTHAVEYRPAGPKLKNRRALVTAAMLPRFRAWLESLVGPLTHYAEHPAPGVEPLDAAPALHAPAPSADNALAPPGDLPGTAAAGATPNEERGSHCGAALDPAGARRASADRLNPGDEESSLND